MDIEQILQSWDSQNKHHTKPCSNALCGVTADYVTIFSRPTKECPIPVTCLGFWSKINNKRVFRVEHHYVLFTDMNDARIQKCIEFILSRKLALKDKS